MICFQIQCQDIDLILIVKEYDMKLDTDMNVHLAIQELGYSSRQPCG